MLTPPSTLDTVGKALWRDIIGDVAPDWELDSRDLSLLESACKTASTIARLEAVIETEGDMVAGSKGQMRINPAVGEARMQRAQMSSLLRQIEMAPPRAKTGHLNGRQRAALRLAETPEMKAA